jgi:hypothetical protein
MAIDHYGKIVDQDLFVPTHMIGRVSFPLFATIVGLRLAVSPSLAGRYLRRMIPWAIVTQPIYVLAGREWMLGNILFTLALGVIAWLALGRISRGRHLGGAALLALVAVLSIPVEFGPPGVAMVVVTALLASSDPGLGLGASGPLGVLVNLRLTPPFLRMIDLTALLSTAVAAASTHFRLRLPRLPTQAFYAFYPAHLLALHLIDLYAL